MSTPPFPLRHLGLALRDARRGRLPVPAPARGSFSSGAVSRRSYTSYNAAVAGLTAEQEEFRQVVHDFAQKEIAPRAAEIDKTNKLPDDIFPKMGEMGLLGVTVPEEMGGLGLGYFEHTLAMEELSRASASIALSYGAHSNLHVNQLKRWGTKKQIDRYLPKLLSGEHIGSLAMSEPNAGSDVVSMRTHAVRHGGGGGGAGASASGSGNGNGNGNANMSESENGNGNHGRWILNGSKCWITNAPVASTFIVYAKTNKEGKGSRGITAFLVERGMKGFSVGEGLDKFGMRGSPTAEIFFDNVEIPEENVLGEVNKGAAVLMSGLDLERLVLSGGPLGIMQAALDLSLQYTHEREQFGQKIATFQLMQGKLADMYTKLSASRAYTYAVARACDAGNVSRQDCAGSILYSSDRAVEVAMDAQQCLGGNGYINEYEAGRLLRDSRLYTVGAGTQEIRRMLIGRGFNEEFQAASGRVVAQ